MRSVVAIIAVILVGAAPATAQAPTLEDRLTNTEAEIAALTERVMILESAVRDLQWCWRDGKAVNVRYPSRNLKLGGQRGAFYVPTVRRICLSLGADPYPGR